MNQVWIVIGAIAGAIGAIASCSEKVQHPQTNSGSTPNISVVVNPPVVAPASVNQPEPTQNATQPTTNGATSQIAYNSKSSVGSVVLSGSTEVIPSVLDSYHELRLINTTRISGNNGASADLRLHDAQERVRLANYIAQNAHLLEGLASTNPDIQGALQESKRLPEYQAELASLSR
jgi:hypothetical protein